MNEPSSTGREEVTVTRDVEAVIVPAGNKVLIPEGVPVTITQSLGGSYTVITPVQYYGQQETEPYIRASILLDGADQPLGQQDIRSIPIAEFRAGMRVRAVFKPPAERDLGELDNRWGSTGNVLSHWEPTGEPDLPFDQIAEHNW